MSKVKKKLLIVAATASVVIATAAGVYYWDTIVLGFLAFMVWVKKIAMAEKEIKERIRRGVFPGQVQQPEKSEGSDER